MVVDDVAFVEDDSTIFVDDEAFVDDSMIFVDDEAFEDSTIFVDDAAAFDDAFVDDARCNTGQEMDLLWSTHLTIIRDRLRGAPQSWNEQRFGLLR